MTRAPESLILRTQLLSASCFQEQMRSQVLYERNSKDL